jgi:hypothetical protein
MDAVRRRWLARLPDRPLWVETRDLLSRSGSMLIEHPTRAGFVVWRAEAGLGSVVGEPDPSALALAAGDVPELLAFADNVDRVRSLLPGFVAEPATIFADSGRWPTAPPHRCREIGPGEIAALDRLPDDLLEQLADAADAGVPVVAAFDGALPVAFAYVAAETAALWDVSIDTIPSHRRRGYAAAAALHLMRGMREKGKSAVWGAVDGNLASANLARRLGFVESGRLWVLTRWDGATPGAGGGPLPAKPREAEDGPMG